MINLCVYGVPPSPVYKGVEEGEGRPSLWRALGGVLLPPGVGLPPFLVGIGEGRGGGEEGKGGAAPLSLSYSDSRGGGAPLALACPSLSPLRPNKAH